MQESSKTHTSIVFQRKNLCCMHYKQFCSETWASGASASGPLTLGAPCFRIPSLKLSEFPSGVWDRLGCWCHLGRMSQIWVWAHVGLGELFNPCLMCEVGHIPLEVLRLMPMGLSQGLVARPPFAAQYLFMESCKIESTVWC